MPMDRRTPYARPTTLYSSRQLAKQHIKQASSGYTARMPLFAGKKPTKFSIRRGGRSDGAGTYSGQYVKFSDAYELQKTLQEEQATTQRNKEMTEMRDAVKKTLIAQGLPHIATEAEEEATKLKAAEINRTQSTEEIEKKLDVIIAKKLAEQDLPDAVRERFDQYDKQLAQVDTRQEAINLSRQVAEMEGRTNEQFQTMKQSQEEANLLRVKGALQEQKDRTDYQEGLKRDVEELREAAQAGNRESATRLREVMDKLNRSEKDTAQRFATAEGEAKLREQQSMKQERENLVGLAGQVAALRERADNATTKQDLEQAKKDLQEQLAAAQQAGMEGVEDTLTKLQQQLKSREAELAGIKAEQEVAEKSRKAQEEINEHLRDPVGDMDADQSASEVRQAEIDKLQEAVDEGSATDAQNAKLNRLRDQLKRRQIRGSKSIVEPEEPGRLSGSKRKKAKLPPKDAPTEESP